MEKPKPIAENVTADLAVSDVLRVFREHPEKDLKSTYPPLRLKGGETIIYEKTHPLLSDGHEQTGHARAKRNQDSWSGLGRGGAYMVWSWKRWGLPFWRVGPTTRSGMVCILYPPKLSTTAKFTTQGCGFYFNT